MNPLRNGNFNSSEIVALTGIAKREMTESELEKYKKENPKSKAKLTEDQNELPKTALTFIKEKNRERRAKRSINTESGGRAQWWGKVCELRAFTFLPNDYSISSDTTEFHPTIPNWCGTKDGEKHGEQKTIYDIKCPWTLSSFFDFAESKTIDEVRANHSDGEKYYWQIVSNACIAGATHGELIVYCPFQDELDEIRELASNYDGDANKVAWINFASDEDLPYLIREGKYKNIYIFNFEIPAEDKHFLETRVIQASKLLDND